MGVLDGPLGSVASTLIGTFGRSATYTQPGSGGAYNPDTGDIEGAGAPTNTSCSVVFDDSRAAVGNIGLFDEALIEDGDRIGLVPRTDLGFEPNPGEDLLMEGENVWQVVQFKPYSSGDNEAMYALLLRSTQRAGGFDSGFDAGFA